MILVVAEQRDDALNRASWEAIAAAQQMAGAWPIAVLALGASVGDVAKQLAQADVAEVLTGEHAALGQYTPDAFTMALKGVIDQKKPAVVLMAHTYQARDFAPMLAARLRVSLITDVIGISGDGASATFTRPMFQGKLTATVRATSNGTVPSSPCRLARSAPTPSGAVVPPRSPRSRSPSTRRRFDSSQRRRSRKPSRRSI